MKLPMADDSFDRNEVCAMFDAFLDADFSYFDTAHVYLGGKSEIAPRENFLLADKLST